MDNALTYPKVVYMSYTGPIDEAAAGKISQAVSHASGKGSKEIHLFMNSNGGSVADAIFLYRFLRTLSPIVFKLVMHNFGNVASAAVIVFLAAEPENRYCSKHSLFMIHSVSAPDLKAPTIFRLKRAIEGIHVDEQRTEAIIRERTHTPSRVLAQRKSKDVFILPADAVRYGYATAVQEFTLPDDAGVCTIT